jgi:hypothetical protein
MSLKAVLFAVSTALMVTACTDTTTVSSGANKHVTVVNNSGKTMRYFQGSNTGSTSWEEDILGSDVLPSGSRVDVNFEDGSGYCTFDFRATFSDGSSQIINGVDVCTTSSVTFN